MEQLRRNARVNVNLPISCFFYEKDNYHCQLVSNGSIRNISLGGMKIEIPSPLKAKISATHQLDYQIHLPDPFQPIRGQGEIRWKNIDLKNDLINIGLAFTSMDQDNREEISCILEELSDLG